MRTGLLATLACAGLVVGVVVCAGCASVAVRAEPPAPACAPGSLVFAAPYLPSGVAFSPAGDALVVVDRGALTVYDPATLAVRRTLLPRIDRWSAVAFSADGAALRAETVDGLRFSFDAKTWRATRLTDDRAVEPGHALQDDEMSWYAQRIAGVSEASKRGQSAGAWFLQSLGLPALPKGVEATAFALARVGTHGARTTFEALDPREPIADGHVFRAVLADSKGTLHLYDAERERHRSDALAGTTIAALSISGERVVVGLTTGEIAIFRSDLALESRFLVRPPPPFDSPSVRLTRDERGAVHGFRALELDPERRRLAWVSTDLVFGVFDVEARRSLAQLRGTGAQLTTALWLDERRIAVHTFDRLTIWDTIAGAALRERAQAFSLVVPTPAGLLGVRDDGKGELLDARTLAAVREICFLPAGCREPPLVRPEWLPEASWNRLSPAARRRQLEVAKSDQDRAFEKASREVRAALAPDGRSLAVLHPPIEVREPATEGELALWDLGSLARTRSVPLAGCYAWKLSYHSADVLDVCEKERRDARTLALLPGEPEKPDPLRGGVDVEEFAVGGVGVGVYRAPNSDYVGVARATNEVLLELAQPEVKGEPPESKVTEHERLQLRSQTFVAAAPGGHRFLLLGRGEPEKEGWFPGYAVEAGSLQVWCAPDRPVPEGAPLLPEEPLVAEIDGVTERAVEGFPEKVLAAAEGGPDVFVLGADALGKTPSLVAVGSDLSRARAIALPKGGPWRAILPSPEGETIWLRGERAVARLDRGRGWTTFALVDGDEQMRFFAPLSPEAAVIVGGRGCSAAETVASKAEANLRPYFELHPEKLVDKSGKHHSLAELGELAAQGRWWPWAVDGGCQDISIVGLPQPLRRTVIPPSSPADYVAWRGGFAGLGSPTVVYQDASWLDAKTPLAATLGQLGAKEALAAGRRVYVRRSGKLDALDVATGERAATIALENADAVEVNAAGAEIFQATIPGGALDAYWAVDAAGKHVPLVQPRAPAWAGYGAPRLAPGQTARAFTTERGLVLRDGARFTILFAAASRRGGLAERRRSGGE